MHSDFKDNPMDIFRSPIRSYVALLSNQVKRQGPIPLFSGHGALYLYYTGLRVSRLLNLRAVSGSKSDTPTRAKNLEASYSNEQKKQAKEEDRRQESEDRRKPKTGMVE
jgi:hypothetical protein